MERRSPPNHPFVADGRHSSSSLPVARWKKQLIASAGQSLHGLMPSVCSAPQRQPCLTPASAAYRQHWLVPMLASTVCLPALADACTDWPDLWVDKSSPRRDPSSGTISAPASPVHSWLCSALSSDTLPGGGGEDSVTLLFRPPSPPPPVGEEQWAGSCQSAPYPT